MENFFTFVMHHWFLVSLFVVLLILVIWYETQGKVNGLSRINTQRAIHLINRENAVVFDIRERTLYDKGHIANAHNLPEAQMDSFNFDKYKNMPIIVVCSTGASAPRFGKKLKDKGLNPVFFLQGGMTAWSDANLPVVKK